MKELREYLNEDILEVPEISLALSQAREHLPNTALPLKF